MKHQAVNSFGDGLVRDLNELTTPNKSLTDCLNGTIITYNGNELSLQNDMGNAKVGTSFLPNGYVPVGMKEYGGIIYVASWNPETKKGQVGCFPSPQRLFGDDESNFTELSIDLSQFVSYDKSKLWINTEYTRQLIFKTENDCKKFYSADKYILVSEKINDRIKSLIQEGILKLRLAVVSENGFIEYLDDSKLHKYDNGLFIYEKKSDEEISNLLANNEVQIFNAKNSGKLMFIVEYNTIQDFDLSRTYEVTKEGKIKIKFEGQVTLKDGIDTKTKTGIEVIKPESEVDNLTATSKEFGQEDKIDYEIYPCTKYGILERLGKKGTINLGYLIKNKSSLSSWQYFVGDQSVTIDWTFDYLDINNNTTIDKISFVFIEVNENNTNDKTIASFKDASNKGQYVYDIEMDTYSGSFTTSIPFSSEADNGIEKNKIYVCRIDIKTTDGTNSDPLFNLVYTGTYFNDKDINLYRKDGTRDEFVINPDVTLSETDRKVTTKYISGDIVRNSEPTADDFIFEADYTKSKTTSWDVQNIYDLTYKASANIPTIIEKENFTYNINDAFAGELSTINLSVQQIEAKQNNSFNAQSWITDSSATSKTNDIKFTVNVKNTITADIESDPSETWVENSIRMVPVCGDDTEPSNMFQWNGTGVGDTLECLAIYKHGVHFMNWDEWKEQQSTDDNKLAGSPGNDTNIETAMYSLGRPTVAAMIGSHGDEASYAMSSSCRPYRKSEGGYFWRGNSQELANQDGFMVVTWRTTNDRYRCVNLGSNINESGDSQDTLRKSAHLIVKSILSQLLIARQVNVNVKYKSIVEDSIKYDDSFEVYADLTVTFKDTTINDYAETWCEKLGMINYLPKFTINNKATTKSQSVGKDVNVKPVRDTMINAKYSIVDFGSIDYLLSHDNGNDLYKKYTKEELISNIFLGELDGQYIPYRTGICPLKKDKATGSYKIRGKAKDQLYMWNDIKPAEYNKSYGSYDILKASLQNINFNGYVEGSQHTFKNDLNVIFKTGYSENITDLRDNQIFLNSSLNDFSYKGDWTKNKDKTAFSICPYAFFGKYSIIKPLRIEAYQNTTIVTVPEEIKKLFNF